MKSKQVKRPKIVFVYGGSVVVGPVKTCNHIEKLLLQLAKESSKRKLNSLEL